VASQPSPLADGRIAAAAKRGFEQHPLVIDGASALLLDVFGDRGVHVHAAVGMASLPFQIPVELEMVFQVR
jgi:enamine deaminase RidA (YjgF/YER057c/UK114 family)